MQTSSPKNIALFLAFALTVLVLIFLVFFQILSTNQILWLESIALLLVVFFGSYLLVYKSICFIIKWKSGEIGILLGEERCY